MYNYDSETELDVYKGHHGSIWSVSFSPDRKLYATGSEDGTIKLVWYFLDLFWVLAMILISCIVEVHKPAIRVVEVNTGGYKMRRGRETEIATISLSPQGS